MRLSALFEEFLAFLRVQQEAARRTVSTYRWCFSDFMEFSRQRLGDTVLIAHFNSELCRAYHYELARRGLQTNSIRVVGSGNSARGRSGNSARSALGAQKLAPGATRRRKRGKGWSQC
jgi:hypothetical protein